MSLPPKKSFRFPPEPSGQDAFKQPAIPPDRAPALPPADPVEDGMTHPALPGANTPPAAANGIQVDEAGAPGHGTDLREPVDTFPHFSPHLRSIASAGLPPYLLANDRPEVAAVAAAAPPDRPRSLYAIHRENPVHLAREAERVHGERSADSPADFAANGLINALSLPRSLDSQTPYAYMQQASASENGKAGEPMLPRTEEVGSILTLVGVNANSATEPQEWPKDPYAQ